jgi:hypothetical protein
MLLVFVVTALISENVFPAEGTASEDYRSWWEHPKVCVWKPEQAVLSS